MGELRTRRGLMTSFSRYIQSSVERQVGDITARLARPWQIGLRRARVIQRGKWVLGRVMARCESSALHAVQVHSVGWVMARCAPVPPGHQV